MVRGVLEHGGSTIAEVLDKAPEPGGLIELHLSAEASQVIHSIEGATESILGATTVGTAGDCQGSLPSTDGSPLEYERIIQSCTLYGIRMIDAAGNPSVDWVWNNGFLYLDGTFAVESYFGPHMGEFIVNLRKVPAEFAPQP